MIFSRFFPKDGWTRSVWIAALMMSVALILLPAIFKLDGRPHADWQQFLGRFHPLVVHLPIGLILLIPLLEVAGATRPALREAAGFVLALGFISCLCALTLGYLLAYGSGDAGPAVTRHMWGAIFLTICVLLCALIHPWWLSGSAGLVSNRLSYIYPVLLACVLLLLAWAAHQGGSLTHGSNYLTEYLPAPIKRLPGVTNVKATFQLHSFYTQHIDPILDKNCVACHGDGKIKGGLRVDSYALLMRGGKDGAVIVPGQPEKSILFTRITLPTSHKQFMPSEGKPPLKPEEIAWIQAWIQQGASPTATSLTGIAVRDEPNDTPPPVGDYSRMNARIEQINKSQGPKLMPVSKKPGDGLVLNTVDAGVNFDDARLAQLEAFAPYIVEAELGRSGVTDACFNLLQKFTHLRALHLENTAITGDGLAKLTQLSQLTYINLSGTKVTRAAIAPLNSMKNLHRIYLYGTPAQPVPAPPDGNTVARSSQ